MRTVSISWCSTELDIQSEKVQAWEEASNDSRRVSCAGGFRARFIPKRCSRIACIVMVA